MNDSVHIILAAGGQERWNAEKYEGIPLIKQLIEIDGEVLIEKIQGQFHGIVVTKSNDIKQHSEKWFEPETNIVTIATLFSTRDLWKGWTTILLGDVLYGENTIKKITEQKEGMMFYGDKGEIYAMKFNLQASVPIVVAINKIVSSPVFLPKFGKLWNLYRELNGIDFRVEGIKDYFTFVSDCRDFDLQKEYIRYAKGK